MKIAVWAANLLGWPIIQMAIARIALSLPLEYFEGDSPFFAIRQWERSGRIYERVFAVKRWKTLLPDGASWFGGFSKKKIKGRDPAYIKTFMLETRRAECAHWCMFWCFPVFFLWNPVWAWFVMFAYAVMANVPFIMVQRYNRLVLSRICASIEARQSAGRHLPAA